MHERILGLVREARFAPGEIVLREGVPTPFLGIVTSGRIGLRLHVPERGATTVLTIDAGELLGWSALVPPYRSTATAVALETTVVAVFDAVTLRGEMADPAFAAAILASVLEAVAGRLGESWSQLLDLFGGPGIDPW
jgi:CRP-like cAMP-binding protein